MSYVVVAHRTDDRWRVDVADVGSTTAAELADVEAAARALLAEHGTADAATVDLQLLLPDFEVDLAQRGVPDHSLRHVEVISGVIALVVVIGALAFLAGWLVR